MSFRPLFATCFVLCLLGAAASQSVSAGGPNTMAIVDRLVAVQRANRANLRPFTVKRDYQLLDKNQERKAQVVAEITMMPSARGEYKIESNSGSMLWQKVLKDVLAKDTQLEHDEERTEISPQNYDFQFVREETFSGVPCYVLNLTPKRNERDLVKGQIWVDKNRALIRRVEGEIIKSPGWWLADLHVQMGFGEVNGMWLHTFTHAVGNVRFKGEYVMESRDLEYQAEGRKASITSRTPSVLAGATVHP